MLKRLSAVGLTTLLWACPALAANCPANPFTFTNGNNADATQVMANFTNLLNCANTALAPIASPTFTGFVGIGSPANPGYPLDVSGIGRFVSPNTGSTGGVIIRDTAGDPDANYLQFVNNANSAQYGFIHGIKGGGIVLGGGNMGAGGQSASLTFYVNGSAGGLSAWSNVSDARLKKNVQPLTGALALVGKLQAVRFNWKSAAERSVGKTMKLPVEASQVGFIAQDVEKVVPEAVSRPKDANDVYGIQEGALVPLLVEAVKEQQAEIEALRASLAALSPK